MSDHSNQGVTRAIHSLERLSEKFIGFAVSVNIGRDKGADSGFVSRSNAAKETLFRESFPKVHEATAAPGSVCCLCELHEKGVVDFLQKSRLGKWVSASRNKLGIHEAEKITEAAGVLDAFSVDFSNECTQHPRLVIRSLGSKISYLGSDSRASRDAFDSKSV
jgi:hypothetical protein